LKKSQLLIQRKLYPRALLQKKKNIIPKLLESSLKKIFLEKKFDKISYNAVALINDHNGMIPIDDIAYTVNILRRQLERKFIDSVGISPKLYSRIIRFHYVKNMIKVRKDCSLISLALDSGYYDQAHFCREYKEFSGMTPIKNY